MSVAVLSNYSQLWVKENVKEEKTKIEKILEVIEIKRKLKSEKTRELFNKYIEINKNICDNQPVIKGTRITVDVAVNILYEHFSEENDTVNFNKIKKEYPSIEKEEQLIAVSLYKLDEIFNETRNVWRFIFS